MSQMPWQCQAPLPDTRANTNSKYHLKLGGGFLLEGNFAKEKSNRKLDQPKL